MAYIEDLTFTNAANISDNDIVYLGKVGDIDPDRRTSIAELITRIQQGVPISSGSLFMTLEATGTNPTVTYSARTGRWSRVGDLVHIEFTITCAVSGGTGETRIYGLPFTPRRLSTLSGRTVNISLGAGRIPYYYVSDFDSSVRLGAYVSGGAATQVPITDWSAASSIIVAGTYTTSDP